MSKQNKINNCRLKATNLSERANNIFFDRKNYNKQYLLSKVHNIAPKCLEIKNRLKSEGKHVIYSSDVNFLKVLMGYLMDDGMELLYGSNLKVNKTLSKNPTMALLSTGTIYGKSLPIPTRKHILNMYNNRQNNINGETLKVLLITDAFREGISLFDVKYMHIAEPSNTETELTQTVGRATRMCGQNGLPFQLNLGWVLQVYIYDVVTSEGKSLAGVLTQRSILKEEIKNVAVDRLLVETKVREQESKTGKHNMIVLNEIPLVKLILVALVKEIKFPGLINKY